MFMRKPIYTLLILFTFFLFSCGQKDSLEHNVSVTTLWAQEDTSHNNYRIPSLIVTKKNTVLAFAEGREAGDAGDIDILLRRSTDNGQSWEEQMVVWNDSTNTCGNPCPVIDQATGRIILFMTWNLGSDHEDVIIKKESESTRIPYMCYSDDDGLTWSEPVNLAKSCKNPDWGWYATGPGVGIQLKLGEFKNRLVIPCNNSYDVNDESEVVRGGFGYGSHVLLSDDGGDTWRMSDIITPRVNESQLVELSKGDLMMNMRSYHKKGCRALSYSKDGGESWSQVLDAPQLTESVCQASFIEYGQYRDDNMYLFSNPAVPFNRNHMTIKASFDDGSSWSNSKLIFEGPSAYSCMTKLPDGNIGILFEAGEEHPYEKIIFASFHPDELFHPGSLINHIK
jgi:sialidase-1